MWGFLYGVLEDMTVELRKKWGWPLLREVALRTRDKRTRPFLNLFLGELSDEGVELLVRRCMFGRYTLRRAKEMEDGKVVRALGGLKRKGRWKVV